MVERTADEMNTYFYSSIFGGLASGFLLFAYIIHSKFRKTPGMLIFWEVLSQFGQWVIVLILSSHTKFGQQVDSLTCDLLGGLWTWCILLGAFYFLTLSYEIYKRVREPLNQTYNKRAVGYHLFGQVLPLIFTLIGGLCDVYGRNLIGFWFIKGNNPVAGMLIILPGVVIFLSLQLCFLALKTMKKQSRYLWRYLIFIFAYFILLFVHITLLAITAFRTIPYEIYRSAVIFQVVGFGLLMIYRIAEVTIFRRYFSQMYRLNQPKMTYGLLNQNFFADLYIDGIKDSMTALSYVFQYVSWTSQIPQSWSQDKPKKWNFEILAEARLSIQTEETQSTQPDRVWKLVEYFPSVFAKIRENDGIWSKYLSNQLRPQENIDNVLENAKNKGGKSGSFFYFTPDKRFIIKSLKKGEFKILTGKFFDDYYKNLSQSLLSRVYGIYKIQFGSKRGLKVMIMGNIVPPDVNKIALFDIKGSKKDRYTIDLDQQIEINDLDSNFTYKDIDFDKFIGQIQLKNANSIIQQVQKDANLLASHNLMDYSVLICISHPLRTNQWPFVFHDDNYSYWIGIIDYLQDYTFRKQIERISKSISTPARELSVMEPKKYAKRFSDKIRDILKAI